MEVRTIMTKKRFYEVDIIRLVVIVLLVAYHAFCPCAHTWKAVYADDIRAYWWLGWIFYAILLPSFVFISGYLFGNQIFKNGGGVVLGTLSLTKEKGF